MKNISIDNLNKLIRDNNGADAVLQTDDEYVVDVDNIVDPRIKYDMDEFISTYESPVSMYGSHRVDESMARLPLWLQNYFQWHAEQRRNPTNETKYTVTTCIGKERCGGTSDRLRPLPYFLLVANATQRVLIIKWTKPHELSEFLMPARDVDWRLPMEYDEMFANAESATCIRSKYGYKGYLSGPCSRYRKLMYEECLEYLSRRIGNDDTQVVGLTLTKRTEEIINDSNTLFQKFSYPRETKVLENWDFPDKFGDIFRVMFQPVPEIGRNLNESMVKLGLVEGQYSSAHVRARYPSDRFITHYVEKAGKKMKYVDKEGDLDIEGDTLKYLTGVSHHAISCAALSTSPPLPVYFASDTNNLTAYIARERQFISSYQEDQNREYGNIYV